MSARRSDMLARIEAERVRQVNLPGSELDARNTPNDWVAIASHYLNEEVRRGGSLPDRQDYEDGLIKAAAVVLAALEHMDVMASKDHFQ